MSTTYEQDKELEFEKKKIENQHERNKAHAVLIAAETGRLDAEAKGNAAFKGARWVHALRSCGRMIGSYVAVHLIWAIAFCVMTWIWVVQGWRG